MHRTRLRSSVEIIGSALAVGQAVAIQLSIYPALGFSTALAHALKAGAWFAVLAVTRHAATYWHQTKLQLGLAI